MKPHIHKVVDITMGLLLVFSLILKLLRFIKTKVHNLYSPNMIMDIGLSVALGIALIYFAWRIRLSFKQNLVILITTFLIISFFTVLVGLSRAGIETYTSYSPDNKSVLLVETKGLPSGGVNIDVYKLKYELFREPLYLHMVYFNTRPVIEIEWVKEYEVIITFIENGNRYPNRININKKK